MQKPKVLASSAKIVYANPRTIKTVIYNDIFTSLWRKKVQSPAK